MVGSGALDMIIFDEPVTFTGIRHQLRGTFLQNVYPSDEARQPVEVTSSIILLNSSQHSKDAGISLCIEDTGPGFILSKDLSKA